MSSTVSSATGLLSSNAERAEHRSSLYLGMAIAMLAIVLIGFSPTFFLFWLFDAPVRPYPFSHGIILTAWYVLFLVQAWLAFRGRVRSHRQLGLIAATIGYAAMLTAAFATLNILMNPIPEVDFTDSARLAQRARIIWGNIGGVLAFTTLLSLGIAFRRNAYVHRKMMLFASISFVSPAVGRVAGWLAETGISLAMFNNSVILSLILAVLLYELVVDRRVHLITLATGVALFSVRIIFLVLIPGIPSAVEFVRPIS